MADIAILIAISSFIITVLFFISLIRSRSAKKDEPVEEEEVRPPRPVRVNRENIARPLGARRNLNRRIVRHESEEEESDDPLADEIALPDGKIGAKKRKKLEMKAEKRAQRERDFQEREERKQRQAMLEEQRKKDEERERAEEAKKEEEERLKKEEEAKKELEEYLKLKECFVVEDEGYDETQADKESQDLLKDFIDFIKNTKVVLMDDLAARFKLKTQEAIERIQTLQSSGQLTGVIDDRGKFIYISQVELEAVAKFIRQRGRVSIAELVESSNILINLTPSVTT